MSLRNVKNRFTPQAYKNLIKKKSHQKRGKRNNQPPVKKSRKARRESAKAYGSNNRNVNVNVRAKNNRQRRKSNRKSLQKSNRILNGGHFGDIILDLFN